MKTKMNFSDIAGMLERDEMREIMGGEYAIPTTIIPPESYDQPMRIPRDELTPSGFVFGTPGKISAPLPGYRTPTFQGGELDTVVVSGRKNSYSNPYGSFQLGGGYNSTYSIGYSDGYGTGVGGGGGNSFHISNYEPLLRFFADVLEDFGASTELAGILAAPFTEGTSLTVASAGAYIGFSGTSLNAILDLYYDGDRDLALTRMATFAATYGLGKVLDKALKVGNLTKSDEIMFRLGTLVYGEAWANQMKDRAQKDK